MKEITIGILAGMGPRSTAPFIDMVVDECQRQYGAVNDQDFPRIMIYSLPTPFFVDRAIDHEKMKQIISAGLKRLEKTGVDFIAIPCNSAHQYFPTLEKNVSVPIINMVAESVKYISPNVREVAIIGTESMIQSKIYQNALETLGVEYIYDPEWQSQANELIKGIKTKTDLLTLKNHWEILLRQMNERGVEQAILGCTDFNVLESNQSENPFIIDATKILATAVVQKYIALKNQV